jgi:hypothetical protein
VRDGGEASLSFPCTAVMPSAGATLPAAYLLHGFGSYCDRNHKERPRTANREPTNCCAKSERSPPPSHTALSGLFTGCAVYDITTTALTMHNPIGYSYNIHPIVSQNLKTRSLVVFKSTNIYKWQLRICFVLLPFLDASLETYGGISSFFLGGGGSEMLLHCG